MSSITSTLIAASAGTGKTYQLSLRFLSLLALGESPEKMIAVTFTRKAAGEFADRILSDLAKGASSDQAADDLARRIIQTLEGSDSMPGLCPRLPDSFKSSLTREAFTSMLRRLVHSLARLNLSTIDSLFSRMASTLTYELGLSSFQMIDTVTERREKSRALLSLYRDCLQSPALSDALETIFIQGIKNDYEAGDMDATMEKLIASYHELFLDCPNQAQWGDPKSLGIPAGQCTPSLTPADMAALAATLLDEAETIDTSDMKATPKKNLQTYKDFLSQATAYPETRYIEPKYESIGELIEKCADYWKPEADQIVSSWLAEETKRACERTKAAHALIMAFEKRYGTSVRDRGRFLFHDVTRILHSNALPEHIRTRLEYRTDCAFKHWMLDEFQDTSRSQWHVLEPFLQEIAEDASFERSIFVVGDVKQSIYQWRGGDPGLFRDLESRSPWSDKLRGASMTLSFRSSQAVLDFANLVCDFQKTAKFARPEAIKRWGTFQRHSSAKTSLTGCAQIWQADSSDDDEKKDEASARTVADILRMVQPTQRGKTCAILVPTNKYAVSLKHRLDTCPDRFPVELCEDAPVGIDSPLGKDLLLFFRWLSTPGDLLVRNFLIHSPLKGLATLHGTTAESWEAWNLLLDREGYAAAMRNISNYLNSADSERDELTGFQKKRLSVWMEESAGFDASGGSLDEWIAHMEGLTRREDPPDDVIRIMTVHKSKGLEFDVVILPVSSSQNFSDKTHLAAFKKKDEAGNIAGILLAPNKYIYQNQPALEKMFAEWEAGQQYEGFCKLYVALTRAIHATYVVLPPGRGKKSSASNESFKTIFQQVCQTEATTESDPSCLYSSGNTSWFEQYPVREKPTAKKEEIRLPSPPPRIIRKTPSSMHGKSANIPAMGKGESQAASFGTAVHRVFERILRLDGDSPPEWLANPATPEEKLVAECLQIPCIKELFAQDENCRILREQPVEAVINGQWLSGTIDRLILSPGKAHIIDFKTDKAATPEELKERHLPQLTAYRNIVSHITGLSENDISATILSTHLKSAIPY